MARWGLPPSYSILWIQKIKDKLIPCSGVIATERSHHYAKNQQDKAKTLRVDKMNNMVHSYKDRIPIWAYNTRSPESPQKTTKVDVFFVFFKRSIQVKNTLEEVDISLWRSTINLYSWGSQQSANQQLHSWAPHFLWRQCYSMGTHRCRWNEATSVFQLLLLRFS